MGIFKKKKPEEVQDPTIPEISLIMPLVPYKVMATDLPIYLDPNGKEAESEYRIAILMALDPDDPVMEPEIVPTRIKYNVGDYVDWSLNSKKLWEQRWYRNPETGKVERAWTFHVEFLGRLIDPADVEKDRGRIDELERRTFEKLKQKREARGRSVH